MHRNVVPWQQTVPDVRLSGCQHREAVSRRRSPVPRHRSKSAGILIASCLAGIFVSTDFSNARDENVPVIPETPWGIAPIPCDPV